MRNSNSIAEFLPIIIALICIAPGELYAQNSAGLDQETETIEHADSDDKFFARIGMFSPDRRLKLGADGLVTGEHVDIDFNEEFNMKQSENLIAIELGWNFGERWSVLGQYFDSRGRSTWTLDQDIEWEDSVFQADSSVSTGTDFSVTRIFFGRTLDTPDRHDIGIGAGFHWLSIRAFIEGTVVSDGGTTTFGTESVQADAPLPNIGGWYRYQITPRLMLDSRLDWLGAKVGIYDGRMINASAGLRYQVVEHFGIGVSYNFFELDVEVDKSEWHGSVNSSYEGAFVYASINW